MAVKRQCRPVCKRPNTDRHAGLDPASSGCLSAFLNWMPDQVRHDKRAIFAHVYPLKILKLLCKRGTGGFRIRIKLNVFLSIAIRGYFHAGIILSEQNALMHQLFKIFKLVFERRVSQRGVNLQWFFKNAFFV